jgi:sigma-B regulation protein RsbU (phosphoserine phosphatase)
MGGRLTTRERRRYWLFILPLLIGVGLAVTVVANSGYQWMRIERLQQRFRPAGAGNAGVLDRIERNLIVNTSAGLALLISILFLGARLRYHVRARRWEQQLALGRTVQSQLVPSGDAGGPHLRMAAEFLPALEVGGDLYDVFTLDDGRVAFALGDVAGKGLPAALLMGQIHGALRANPWHRGPAEHVEFARQLNAMLHGRTSEVRSASLFWGVYYPDGDRLHYVSAGHCPGLLVHAGGIERLESTGPVLGLLKNPHFTHEEVTFRPGDLLVLYSDGVVEGANEQGQEYGEQRLFAVLRRNRGATAEQVRAAILGDYRAFVGNAEVGDDVTLLVLEADPVPQHALAAA